MSTNLPKYRTIEYIEHKLPYKDNDNYEDFLKAYDVLAAKLEEYCIDKLGEDKIHYNFRKTVYDDDGCHYLANKIYATPDLNYIVIITKQDDYLITRTFYQELVKRKSRKPKA